MGTITATGLGKAYKQYPSPWFRLAEWLLPRSVPRHRLHWVLQGIDLTIAPGETVGLIGINGAGKSTLLKILAGTTRPTTGSLHMTGRVAALLELGMGFHPDFSGRQNVYMAGQLMGLSASDIQSLMPAIEAFAEIGEYIDQPVRVYSSGMQMRLAFSIATAARPDILIVDEALSVGDAYFQHKSFDRIRQFRAQGTTILLVSHDKGVIQSICDRAILLSEGRIAMQGAPDTVMDYYNALLAEREAHNIEQTVTADGRIQTLSGSGEATLEDIQLLNAQDEPLEVVEVGQSVTLQIRVRIHQPIDTLVFGYLIKDRLGQSVYGTNTHHLDQPQEHVQPGETITCRFAFQANLGPGNYSISTAHVSTGDHLTNNYEWRDLALLFTVVNLRHPHFEGSNWLPPTLHIARP
jgi:lipopolysaccharide transport system ATP-binding protein